MDICNAIHDHLQLTVRFVYQIANCDTSFEALGLSSTCVSDDTPYDYHRCTVITEFFQLLSSLPHADARIRSLVKFFHHSHRLACLSVALIKI